MDRLVPWTVAAFAAGIAAVRVLDPAWAPAGIAAVGLAALLAGRIPALRRLLPAPFDARVPPAVLAAGFLLGCARGGVEDLPPGPASLERVLPREPFPVLLEGVAVTAPDPVPPSGPGGAGRDRPPSASFHLAVERILGDRGPVEAGGDALVLVEGGAPPLLPGDRVRVAGMARLPAAFRNPGGRDRAAEARDRGVACTVDAPGPGAVAVLGRGSFPGPARVGARVRGAALFAIHRAARDQGAALLEALLVGRKDGLDPGLVRDFRRTGTWHVLVVSGLNVAIAAAAAAAALRLLGAGPGTRTAGAFAAAFAVSGASGFGAPATRALLAIALAAAAPVLRRRADPVHSLSVAAGLLLLWRSTFLVDAGFQLSFAAVLGILRLGPAIGDALFARRRFLRRFPIPAADRSLRRRLGDILERGLPTALSAWAATAPILAWHFGSFAAVTPLANLLVVPATLAAMAAAPGILLLGAVLPSASAYLADGAARALGLLAGSLAALPGAWVLLPAPPPWLLAADAAVLAAAALRPSRRLLLAAAAGLAALGSLPFLLPPGPGAPSFLVLDTGHGLSVLADAGSTRVLYDAGGRGPRVAEETILPALSARGVPALGALLISHEDWDHFGAAREVIESLPVGLLVVNRDFGRTYAGRDLLAAAERQGVPVLRAAAGDRLAWPGMEAEVLHPPREGWEPPSDNDGSLAVRLRMEGGPSAILAGDLEGPGIRRLLLSGADLRADLLVLPHHGTRSAEGSDALAAAVRARSVVASAGASTALRGPAASPFVARYLVTAEEGAILVTGEGGGPAVKR